MRNGDELRKVEVTYVNPGESGTDREWQLGTVSRQSKAYVQKVAAKGDTVAVFEPGRIVHYIYKGDTLCYKGEQSRRTYCLLDSMRPMLHDPFRYGDSISGSYMGKGMDENLKLTVTGWGYSVADGTGMLANAEDTVRHITRLHMFDDRTETYNGEYQERIILERYLWFRAGYRYPVMESVLRSWLQNDTTTVPLDSVTYLYLPDMQEELAEDAVNDSIRILLDCEVGASVIPAISNLQASLSADGSRLEVNFTLTEAGSMTFRACDVTGNMLGYAHYENLPEGDWKKSVELSRQPVGNTVMLNIDCGEQTMSLKIHQ